MDINPHAPQMNYTADGFPLSSEDAFKLYARSEEFESLTTDDKTIIGALNELNAKSDNYVENVKTVEISTLETDSKTVAGAINEHETDITNLRLQESSLNNRVSQLEVDVEDLKQDKLTFTDAVFTNPNYFTGNDNAPLIVTEHYVAVSYVADVEQDIQYTDGEVEVININLSQTATLDLVNMPTSFYIPARITYFDSNEHFVKNVSTLLEARWEHGQNSYDISIYLHDEIDNNGSTTKPKLFFSGVIPYVSIKTLEE